MGMGLGMGMDPAHLMHEEKIRLGVSFTGGGTSKHSPGNRDTFGVTFEIPRRAVLQQSRSTSPLAPC